MENPHVDLVLAKIDTIITSVEENVEHIRPLAIPLRNRRSGRERLVTWPATTAAGVKKFTALLLVLRLVEEAVSAGRIITKRAIYYQNPDLFGSQKYVDGLVDEIAFTFGVGRNALNIAAVAKGLVAGTIDIRTADGPILRCNAANTQGVLIPDVSAITGFEKSDLHWVLLIEKEATFRGLVSTRFHESASIGPGLLITGKGYPDLMTRRFVHALHAAFPHLPFYALVDFDPHGLHIMLTYKHGSRALQHEEDATLPSLGWIGPKSDDVRAIVSTDVPLGSVDAPNQSESSRSDAPLEGQREEESKLFHNVLSLTERDRGLASRLLDTAVQQGSRDPDLIRELQVMLMLNTKAEIQCVDDGGDATTWLDLALQIVTSAA